ncbi:hypothetical protein A1O3_04756 [Capronia epimyces CBS 606.96]|uniref:Uncharacterized protein n=1 Tax=Capronia epimyces CBS 606.96 TaxID=1182542 RepID=W9YP95_9EURO|nr:uncharacterized protein A1O3_04756 [Capronia epimyces CBS 606.96]EXJ84089.1 hypothetical protein A1O3_04756 [Capronia epimyces CBS 606.96]
MIAATAAPIPIPALAPVESPVDDKAEDMSSGDVMLSLLGVANAVLGLLPGAVTVTVGKTEALVLRLEVEVEALWVAAADELVDEVPGLVDTIAPNPLRTMPRFAEQQAGSLSQQ